MPHRNAPKVPNDVTCSLPIHIFTEIDRHAPNKTPRLNSLNKVKYSLTRTTEQIARGLKLLINSLFTIEYVSFKNTEQICYLLRKKNPLPEHWKGKNK